jgi:hypothetical protein
VVVCETVIGGPGPYVPWQCSFSSGNIVAGACFELCGHKVPFYQVTFPFVNSYLDQDFSGILQIETDVLTHCI